MAAGLAALAVTDFRPLFNTTGKAYAAIAKGIAAKVSIAKTWELHPLVRGMLLEAKMAAQYASKGFEWLAETASPLFKKIDFYDSTTKAGISFKTVNSKGSFDFENIIKNIDELAELRGIGSTAQWGRDLKIKSVELHIATPQNYDRSVLKDVEKYAQKRKVDLKYVNVK